MRWLAPAFLLLLLPLAPGGVGQVPDVGLYDFDIDTDGQTIVIDKVPGVGVTSLTFRDLSRDGGGGYLPDASGVRQFPHYTSFRAEPIGELPTGWNIQPMTTIQTFSGDTVEVEVRVNVIGSVEDPYLRFRVNATTETDGGTFHREAIFTFYTTGIGGFRAQPGPALDNLKPRETGQASVRLISTSTVPRTIDFEILDNPCGFRVVPPATRILAPKETDEVPFTVQAPEDRFWYYGVDCTILVGATAREASSLQSTVPINAQVDGFYVAPEWVFWIVVVALFLLVAILLAKRSRSRREEEVHGKPQKPWTIPVEAVYLRHLKEQDERAWYVVRHHLMEEEYQSALMWYRSLRKAKRGEWRKEALIIGQERSHDRWQRRWQRRLEKPERRADVFERRLQKKLDRKTKRRHGKAHRRWEKTVAKIEGAQKKRDERALAAWEKQAARAEKRGRTPPPKPETTAPTLPEEPVLEPVPLSSHGWQKKADRMRRKMTKWKGNLEVQYERKEARRVHKMRRKARRVAAKIDDPDFLLEHPLLREADA